MPIHPKVKKIYDKYYSSPITEVDMKFLEAISDELFHLELLISRYVHGRSD